MSSLQWWCRLEVALPNRGRKLLLNSYRFLTFDIWGDHSRNLSATDIADMDAGSTKKFDGKWNIYSENEVTEYYASIAYIAQVRTKSGRVIKADPKVVLEEARKFSKKFAEGDLEPTPEKK